MTAALHHYCSLTRDVSISGLFHALALISLGAIQHKVSVWTEQRLADNLTFFSTLRRYVDRGCLEQDFALFEDGGTEGLHLSFGVYGLISGVQFLSEAKDLLKGDPFRFLMSNER